MAITVVQTASAGTAPPPVAFASNVTAGNTVFLVAGAYTSASATISSGSVTLGGASVSGTVAFFNPGGTNGINSPLNGTNGVYLTVWMLPDCPGGSNSVGYGLSGQSGFTGTAVFEVSGLGTTPGLDRSSSGSNATTTAVDSGASGGITVPAEFILGAAQIFGGSGAGPAGWTNTQASSNTWAGWQVSTTAGTSYDWAQTASAGNPWAAAVVTIQVTPAAPTPAQVLISAPYRPPPPPGRAPTQVITGRAPAAPAELAATIQAAMPYRPPWQVAPQVITGTAQGSVQQATAAITGTGGVAASVSLSVTAQAAGTGTVTPQATLTSPAVLAGTGTLTAAGGQQGPFTVGTLTAADSPAAGGTLTATDQRTGGPA